MVPWEARPTEGELIRNLLRGHPALAGNELPRALFALARGGPDDDQDQKNQAEDSVHAAENVIAIVIRASVRQICGGIMAGEFRSLKGQLLLDSGQLRGSFFHRSVVLICHHD